MIDHHGHRRAHAAGYTLIEVLIAVSILGLLIAGSLTALRAGFMAYGASTEQASRQAAARMVMQRTLAMIRTARLHDPYDPAQPGLQLPSPDAAGHPLSSVGVQMVLPDDHVARIWWQANTAYGDPDLGDLVMSDLTTGQTETVMQRVRCRRTDPGGEPFIFTLSSRTSDEGLLLSRATLHLFAERDEAATTELERDGQGGPMIQLVGSTAPRRNLE